MRLRRWQGLGALLLFSGLTALYLRPTGHRLATALPSDLGDPRFNLVILKWGMHQLRSGLFESWSDFWNLPFFFPAPAALTLSDHLFGPAAVATLFTALWPSPIAAYNFLFVGAFVLCGWATWWVCRRQGLAFAPALLAGCVFAFSSFRWEQKSHLQVLLAGWVPLLFWSWDRLLDRPSWRRAVPFLAFYALHVTGGSYLAYMVHFPLLAFAACRWRTFAEPRAWRVLAPTGVLGAALLVPFFVPYWQSAHDLGRTRPDREIQMFSATALSFATPAEQSLYGTLPPFAAWRRPENALFAGFLPTALLACAAVAAWRRYRLPPVRPLSYPQRAALAGLLGLAAFAVLAGEARTLRASWHLELSVAPYSTALVALVVSGAAWLFFRRRWGGHLGWAWGAMPPWDRGVLAAGLLSLALCFPLVYLPLAPWIPGLSSMRVPARFYVFVSFAACWFAARGFAHLASRRPAGVGRQIGAALLLAALAVDLAPRPIPWVRLPTEAEFPRVYGWIAERPEVRAVLELPMAADISGLVSVDLGYLYFASRDWKPRVNGYSGYVPEANLRFRRSCSPLPDAACLEELRGWGVTHLVVNTAGGTTWRERRERRRLRRWQGTLPLRPVYADRQAQVYAIE